MNWQLVMIVMNIDENESFAILLGVYDIPHDHYSNGNLYL